LHAQQVQQLLQQQAQQQQQQKQQALHQQLQLLQQQGGAGLPTVLSGPNSQGGGMRGPTGQAQPGRF
jgi:hypothetical protein